MEFDMNPHNYYGDYSMEGQEAAFERRNTELDREIVDGLFDVLRDEAFEPEFTHDGILFEVSEPQPFNFKVKLSAQEGHKAEFYFKISELMESNMHVDVVGHANLNSAGGFDDTELALHFLSVGIRTDDNVQSVLAITPQNGNVREYDVPLPFKELVSSGLKDLKTPSYLTKEEVEFMRDSQADHHDAPKELERNGERYLLTGAGEIGRNGTGLAQNVEFIFAEVAEKGIVELVPGEDDAGKYQLIYLHESLQDTVVDDMFEILSRYTTDFDPAGIRQEVTEYFAKPEFAHLQAVEEAKYDPTRVFREDES